MTEHTIIAVMMAGQNSLISPACFVLRQYVKFKKGTGIEACSNIAKG